MALSAYLQCCQPPTCPWDYCWCFYSPVPPCAADPNLLGRCLCGSFCIAVTCVDFPQPPKLTLCVAGLVCTCLSSQGLPSVSWGLCALVLAPQAWPLLCGACKHLSQLPVCTLGVTHLMCTCFSCPCLPSVLRGFCALVSSHCLHSLLRGLFLLLSAGRVVWTAQVYMPSLYGHPSPSLCANCVCCITLGYLVLPSVLQGLNVLAGFVCCTTLSFPSTLSGATVLELLMGWKVQLSLFAALHVPALLGFQRLCSSTLGLPVREFPCAWERLLFQGSLLLLGHKLLPRTSMSFPFLCLSPLSYLISGRLVCPPWRPGSSAVVYIQFAL